MVIPKPVKPRAGGALALAGAVLLLAACGSSSSSSSKTSSAATTTKAAAKSTAPGSSGAVRVATAKNGQGTYLVGPSGRTLYLWAADSNGQSHCSGACATAWPPLTTKGTPAAGGGVKAASLGTITRSDGSHQVTYDGHPLYTFVDDSAAGQTNGQGSDAFGAKWWLVTPSGQPITTSGSSAPASSSGSSSSSGPYGSGY